MRNVGVISGRVNDGNALRGVRNKEWHSGNSRQLTCVRIYRVPVDGCWFPRADFHVHEIEKLPE